MVPHGLTFTPDLCMQKPAQLSTRFLITWNFRFGPLNCASCIFPVLYTTNLPPKQAPSEISEVPTPRLCRLTSPACRHANDFSDTAPTLIPQLQILQPQSGCYPLGTGSAQIRRSIDPNRRRVRWLSASNSQ